jgi:hypothetical protein
MTYTIKNYDQSTLVSIQDGTTDESTSLTLVGKNVSGFGAIQNENFLYLLQNFANSSSPANPVTGQIWYDTDHAQLKFFDSASWQILPVLSPNNTSGSSGSLYIDPTTNQLLINTAFSGTATYAVIGPEAVPGFGTTRLLSTSLTSVSVPRTRSVIEIIVDGEIVAIISTSSFFVDSSNSIPGISQVNRGITFKNYSNNDFTLYGVSQLSNLSTTATNIVGGATGSLIVQSGSGLSTTLAIGANGNILLSDGTNPTWASTATLLVSHAIRTDNITGGGQGSIPYQASNGSTTYVDLGNVGYMLTAGASRPVWSDPAKLSVSSATTATYAESFNTSTVVAHAILADSATNATNASAVPWTGITSPPAFVLLPIGAIIMWYGTYQNIPAGWQECNGTNGTPNLTGMFVVGADGDSGGTSNWPVGKTGGTANTVLPAHTHTPTVSDPGHHHVYEMAGGLEPQSGNTTNCFTANSTADTSVSITGITVSIGSAGTGTGVGTNLPPYYAVYYIMKIS